MSDVEEQNQAEIVDDNSIKSLPGEKREEIRKAVKGMASLQKEIDHLYSILEEQDEFNQLLEDISDVEKKQSKYKRIIQSTMKEFGRFDGYSVETDKYYIKVYKTSESTTVHEDHITDEWWRKIVNTRVAGQKIHKKSIHEDRFLEAVNRGKLSREDLVEDGILETSVSRAPTVKVKLKD